MYEGIELSLDTHELRPGLYCIDDSGISKAFLLVGDNKACVIDTANGFNDLYAEVRKYTDKPLVVVNTHGHPDHFFGNVFFDHAYLNSKDWELAENFTRMPEIEAELKRRGGTFPEFKEIKEGDRIDLGGRTLEVYSLPGHTVGSIVLLCPEERILFTGDSINHHLFLQLEGCPTVEECLNELESKMWLKDKADFILHGHGNGFDDIALMDYLLDAMREIVSDKTDKDELLEFGPGAMAMRHEFKVDTDRQYNCIDSMIWYQRGNVHKPIP